MFNLNGGGRSAIKAFRKADVHLKCDERILGDSEFVDKVFSMANGTSGTLPTSKLYAFNVQM